MWKIIESRGLKQALYVRGGSSATQTFVSFLISRLSSNYHIRNVQTCYNNLGASAITSSGAPLVDVDSYGESTVITLSITIDS